MILTPIWLNPSTWSTLFTVIRELGIVWLKTLNLALVGRKPNLFRWFLSLVFFFSIFLFDQGVLVFLGVILHLVFGFCGWWWLWRYFASLTYWASMNMISSHCQCSLIHTILRCMQQCMISSYEFWLHLSWRLTSWATRSGWCSLWHRGIVRVYSLSDLVYSFSLSPLLFIFLFFLFVSV